MTKLTIDFETQCELNLRAVGAYEYSMHKSCKVMCLSFKRSGESKSPYLFNMAQMNRPYSESVSEFRMTWQTWIGSPDFVFSAHNAFFEQCIYNNVLVRRFGWPKIPIHKWRCTAAKAAASALPRNLADAGAVMRTLTQKDYEGHRVMMKLCKPTSAYKAWVEAKKEIAEGKNVGIKKQKIAEKPRPLKFYTPESHPEDFAKLYHYCKIDVISEELLDASLPDLTPKEQELWFIDQKINLRGVAVDMPLVKKISSIMVAEAKTMTRELDILTMGLVSSGNARAAILDFLSLEGLELPNLRAATVDEFLENGLATGDAKRLLEIRKSLAKSSTAKYKKFLERAATDGRVRDIVLFLGAQRTGRWAGVGIQPQNFPRGVVKDVFEAIMRINTCSLEDLKMLYGENLMPLFASVLRGMFVASPGCEMFVEDYSAIECRVLYWLAGHEAGLEHFRNGRDPYVIRAAKIFKKSILDVTDDERQVGKAAELGCGYQMGDRKFVTSAWDVYRAKVDRTIAKVAVTSFREDNWPVVEMWGEYQDAAIMAVENPGKFYRVGKVVFYRKGRFLKIRLPSGRDLTFADPQVVWEATKKLELNKETYYASTPQMLKSLLNDGAKVVGSFDSKKLTYFEVNQMARKVDCVIPKWALERTYGGKLVEGVTQAVARDILAEAIVRAEKKGFSVLMHSHDELVSEAPKGKFKSEDYKKIMEQLPEWATGLPLKSGGWVGERYKKG